MQSTDIAVTPVIRQIFDEGETSFAFALARTARMMD
jgi:hypothetical protein